MDNNRSYSTTDVRRPTSTTTVTTIYSNRQPLSTFQDRAQEKLIRHKLFLLSCEKLAALRQANDGNVLRRNLGILEVARKARSSDYYPTNECTNLLTFRDKDTRNGPLFTRRASSTTSMAAFSATSVAAPTQAVAATPVVTSPSAEEDAYPKFVPASKPAPPASSLTKPATLPWSCDEVVEYSVQDVRATPNDIFDFDTSDNEIEEGADALDVFFMDEDGGSMARKRKSNRWEAVAEKRHCDEEVVSSPTSVSLPIEIPIPRKQPEQAVLDTLVPLRGFFQFR